MKHTVTTRILVLMGRRANMSIDEIAEACQATKSETLDEIIQLYNIGRVASFHSRLGKTVYNLLPEPSAQDNEIAQMKMNDWMRACDAVDD